MESLETHAGGANTNAHADSTKKQSLVFFEKIRRVRELPAGLLQSVMRAKAEALQGLHIAASS